MASSGGYLVPAVILVILSGVLAFLYFLRRLRTRRLTSGEVDPKRYIEDRAHNQILLTRAAADRLARDQVDVSRVRALLSEAEEKVRRRDFDGALGSARAAQQVLARLRGQPLPSSGPESPSESMITPSAAEPVLAETQPTRWMAAAARSEAAPAALPGIPNGSEEPTAERIRVPKNRVPAQFELRLLVKEIADTPAGKTRDDAEANQASAQAAFDRADFTEALRYALRGRRVLGSKLETVPPAKDHRVPEESKPAATQAPPEPSSGSGVACGRCGRLNASADKFCRGCGAALQGATCGRCGRPLEADDKFCGVCGAPVS